MSLKPIRSSRRSRKQRGAYRSFRQRQQWKPWKGWTGPVVKKNILNLFGKKRFVLGIVALAVIIGGIVVFQSSAFQNPQSVDPFSIFWTDQLGSCPTNLDTWNTLQASCQSVSTVLGGVPVGTGPAIQLASNSTHPAIALTKQSIQLDTITGIEWEALMRYTISAQFTTDRVWAWYLTRNSTLPLTQFYDPRSDTQVALVLEASIAPNSAFTTFDLLMQKNPTSTVASGVTTPCTSQGGTSFLCGTANTRLVSDATTNLNSLDLNTLNFTGTSAAGNEQSKMVGGDLGNSVKPTTNSYPWLDLHENYYLGLWLNANNPNQSVSFLTDNNGATSLDWESGRFTCIINSNCTTQIPPPAPNTSGFFGPIIRVLISIGVFILQSILNFVGFLAPAINSAIQFLESIVVTILNAIGNILGFGNIGTDLATLLSDIITFFSNNVYGLPAFFLQFPNYFTNFLNWLQVVFPVLGPAFTLANGILAFAVNGITFAITVISFGAGLVLFGYAMVAIFGFFLYTGDDAIGGLLTYIGTMEALAFKLLNLVAVLVNLGIDILVHVVSLIPKPIIQMNAAAFPRLPTIQSGAGITMPRMDMGEFRNGNLLSVWLWTMGLWFDTWYESHNPALPGSLCALVSGTCTNMQLLANLLPMLQVFTFVAGGTVLFWVVMRPMAIMGADLGVFESIGVGPGGHQAGTGPSGFGFQTGRAHLIGRIRERREAGKGISSGESQIGRGAFGPQNRSAEEQATA